MKAIDKPTHGSLAWLQVRHRDENGRTRFGASEAPILMGASKFHTLTSLAIRKWSEPEVTEPNASMMRGQILEPALITYAAELLQQDVFTPEQMFINGRMIATLDGLSDDGEWIVEAKTTVTYSSDDELPDEYFWQVIAQFACVPMANHALVVILDKRMRLGSWTLTRSSVQESIDLLLAKADEIGDCLDNHELPGDAQPSEDEIKSLFPNPAGAIELTSEIVQAIEMWQAFKQAKEEAEENEQKYRDQIARFLADRDTGSVNGQSVISFKARKASSRIDVTRLAADHPSLVNEYRTIGKPTRILRLVNGDSK
jgi:predicted phage-related endonuclease